MTLGTLKDAEYREGEKRFVEDLIQSLYDINAERFLVLAGCIAANIDVILGQYGQKVLWNKDGSEIKIDGRYHLAANKETGQQWERVYAEVCNFATDGNPQIAWILRQLRVEIANSIDAVVIGPRQSQAINRSL